MPEELREQMPLLKEVLQAMHISIFEQEGYEADDILGTLSALAEQNGVVPVVVSGDRDLLQIAGENLKVRIPKTKGGRTETEDYYAAQRELKNWGVLFTDGGRKRLVTAEEAKVLKSTGRSVSPGAVLTPLAKEIMEG